MRVVRIDSVAEYFFDASEAAPDLASANKFRPFNSRSGKSVTLSVIGSLSGEK
jgi:hypothetical protein